MEEEVKFIHVPPPDTPGSGSGKTPVIKLGEADSDEPEEEPLVMIICNRPQSGRCW
jgi:hypothetical protein